MMQLVAFSPSGKLKMKKNKVNFGIDRVEVSLLSLTFTFAVVVIQKT